MEPAAALPDVPLPEHLLRASFERAMRASSGNRGLPLGTGSEGILHTILTNSISHVTSPSASFFSICNPPKPGINRGLSTCASAKNFCAVSKSRNLNTPMNDFSSTPQPSAFSLEIQPPSLFSALWRKEAHAHSHACSLGRAGVCQ